MGPLFRLGIVCIEARSLVGALSRSVHFTNRISIQDGSNLAFTYERIRVELVDIPCSDLKVKLLLGGLLVLGEGNAQKEANEYTIFHSAMVKSERWDVLLWKVQNFEIQVGIKSPLT